MTVSRQDRVVIGCAADARYVRPLGVMLKSALVNLAPGRSALIYLLDGGIAQGDKDDVIRLCEPHDAELRWVAAGGISFSGLPLWGRMPVATYFKLGLTQGLPVSVSRIIWLDCDLIVLGDLARLWDLDMAGRHLLAAQDSVVPLVSSPCGVAAFRQLGLPPDAPYFNAGVMLLDTQLWRRDSVPQRTLDYLREHRRAIFFWDQEGLNAILAGKWGRLDPRWNHNTSIPAGARGRNAAGQRSEPWIIHFAGNLKPWRYRGRSPHHRTYYRFVDLTVWRGWRPPRSLKGAMLGRYESSRLRASIYPLEQWGVRLVRMLSRRYVDSAAAVPGAGTPD